MTAPRSELQRNRAELLDRLAIVAHQLMTAHLDRVIWHELRDEIVERFLEAHANFLFSYRRLYTHGQAMRIRRLADQHRDEPHSLHGILAKVRDDPRLAARSLVMADLTDAHSGMGVPPGGIPYNSTRSPETVMEGQNPTGQLNYGSPNCAAMNLYSKESISCRD